MALLQPSLEQGDVLDFDFIQFLRANARSWETSESEVGTLLASAEDDDKATINTKLEELKVDEDEDEDGTKSVESISSGLSDVIVQRKVVCPTYSSGVVRWEELILPKVYDTVLDFIEDSV